MQIEVEVNKNVDISMDLDGTCMVGTDDYEKLKNLPSLNGEKIIGNMSERDPTVPDWAKSPEKPRYTAEELGAVNSEDAISLEEIDAIFNGL